MDQVCVNNAPDWPCVSAQAAILVGETGKFGVQHYLQSQTTSGDTLYVAASRIPGTLSNQPSSFAWRTANGNWVAEFEAVFELNDTLTWKNSGEDHPTDVVITTTAPGVAHFYPIHHDKNVAWPYCQFIVQC